VEEMLGPQQVKVLLVVEAVVLLPQVLVNTRQFGCRS